MSAGRAAALVRAAVALAAGATIACGPPSNGAPASSPSPAAGTGPRIVVEPQAFDFGSALPGRTLQREVAVRNYGDAELVITRIDKTCDCTVVGSYASRIAPGAGTTLRVELTTPERPGRTQQALRITSNDPAQPQVHVDVSAMVLAPPRDAR